MSAPGRVVRRGRSGGAKSRRSVVLKLISVSVVVVTVVVVLVLVSLLQGGELVSIAN